MQFENGGGGVVDPQSGKEGGTGSSSPLPTQTGAGGSSGAGKGKSPISTPLATPGGSSTIRGRGSINVPFLPPRLGGTPIPTERNMPDPNIGADPMDETTPTLMGRAGGSSPVMREGTSGPSPQQAFIEGNNAPMMVDQLNYLVMKAVDAAFAAKGAAFVKPSLTEGGEEWGVPHELSQEPSSVARERYAEKKMEEEHEAQQVRILNKSWLKSRKAKAKETKGEGESTKQKSKVIHGNPQKKKM